MPKKNQVFTTERVEYLRNNVKGIGNKELTEMVNKHFGINLDVQQIRNAKKRYGLNSGITGYFEKGHIPFNKGKKGIGGWEPTQFKKGHKPHNYKPVGTERVNGDGYIDIKIEDPNKWRGKHILTWEEHNGPIPNGHVVIFGDGNNRNFDINNLILVSRQQLLILNRNNLIQNDADLTRTGVIIADLCSAISSKDKELKENAS